MIAGDGGNSLTLGDNFHEKIQSRLQNAAEGGRIYCVIQSRALLLFVLARGTSPWLERSSVRGNKRPAWRTQRPRREARTNIAPPQRAGTSARTQCRSTAWIRMQASRSAWRYPGPL